MTVTDSEGSSVEVSVSVNRKDTEACRTSSTQCERYATVFEFPLLGIDTNNNVSHGAVVDGYRDLVPGSEGEGEYTLRFFNPYENIEQGIEGEVWVGEGVPEVEEETVHCRAAKRRNGECIQYDPDDASSIDDIRCDQLHTIVSDGSGPENELCDKVPGDFVGAWYASSEEEVEEESGGSESEESGNNSSSIIIDKLDIINEVGEVIYIDISEGNPGENGYIISMSDDAIVPLPGGEITTQSVETFATVLYPDGTSYAYPVDAEHPNRFYYMVTEEGDHSLTVSDNSVGLQSEIENRVNLHVIEKRLYVQEGSNQNFGLSDKYIITDLRSGNGSVIDINGNAIDGFSMTAVGAGESSLMLDIDVGGTNYSLLMRVVVYGDLEIRNVEVAEEVDYGYFGGVYFETNKAIDTMGLELDYGEDLIIEIHNQYSANGGGPTRYHV